MRKLPGVDSKAIGTVRSIAGLILIALFLECNAAGLPCPSADPSCDPVGAILAFQPRLTDRWVAVGAAGNFALSSDGQSQWSSFTLAGNNLRAITYGSVGFVAVGDAGRIVLSATGLSGEWFDQASGTAVNLTDVTYGNGLYVAVGGVPAVSATILSSTDGIVWTDRSIPLSRQLTKVLFANNQFYAVGDGGIRAASADGITWTNETAGINPWTTVALGNGVFLFTDDANNMYSSATFAGLPATTGSYASAATILATLFLPVQGVFFLVGDGGQTFVTSNGQGGALLGDTVMGVAWAIASDGSTVTVASDLGSLAYSTDLSTFNPIMVGGSAWYGILHARVPVEMDP
ncbi:MAG: hypothetical protein KDK37_12070 [Leptospiraceae bacterium]|nr:hypothetical protein [Leptospiraceae bacterium]